MNSLRKVIPALALALAGAFGISAAKTAEDYLHGGASQYIQGRLQEAALEVEEGLRKYPNDARLKALAGQLKSMKDQQKKDQGGGEGQGGQGSQQKQDKQDSSQNQQGKDKQDSSKQQQKDQQKDQQQKEQDKDKQGKDKQGGDKDQDKQEDKDKNGQGDGQPPQAEKGKDGDSTGKGAAPVPPGQMSKDEAERLLNSYQDDEKREQKNMQKRSRKPVEVEEDW
jgi:Ca-activated chloride channel family protein